MSRDEYNSEPIRDHPVQRIIAQLLHIDHAQRLNLEEVYNIFRLTDENKREIEDGIDLKNSADFAIVQDRAPSCPVEKTARIPCYFFSIFQ